MRRVKIALANYSDLQASILSWLNRDQSSIPVADFITMAEAELNARVRVRQNMTTATLSLTAGASSVSLPDDFLEEVELNYADYTDTLDRTPFNDIDRARGSGITNRPVGYAINGSSILFDCLADATYSLALRYYQTWDIAADSTNWLLTNAPDCYLFGALAEANAWLGDAGQAEYARGRRDTAVVRVLMADSRNKGGTLRADPVLLVAGR